MIDDRAIGVESRIPGFIPAVELMVVRFQGRDVEFTLENGDSFVFDVDELRKVLEVYDPMEEQRAQDRANAEADEFVRRNS